MSDKAKTVSAVIVFAVGVIAYYLLPVYGYWVQLAAPVVGGLLGLGIYASTAQFGQFRRFVRESRAEISRVVWPSRQETLQTTAVVIAMVLFVGAFLWLVDWIVFSAVRFVMG
ncbi:preprotein translocase subunit SecE [Thiohalorhabdus sp.]|uniref:preprotein translocase subunit SecE n=1 Tax=Thiohalorhabdus sp. TaxID=3094134 RepID=UPI002FC2E961